MGEWMDRVQMEGAILKGGWMDGWWMWTDVKKVDVWTGTGHLAG